MDRYDVTSTSAKADPERVAKILEKYELSDVTFKIDDQGLLSVVPVDDDDGVGDWPSAIKADEMPRREDYANDEDYWDDCHEAFICDEGEGFEALLSELSFCIETPLTILAVSADDSHWTSAAVWQIAPGTGLVESLGASARV